MRLWLIDPRLMCNKHLLGEHVECHMFVGSIKKNKNLDGYYKNGLFDPKFLYVRHESLVLEMLRRNINHKSPLEKIKLPNKKGYIDIVYNYFDLMKRCENCGEKITKHLDKVFNLERKVL